MAEAAGFGPILPSRQAHLGEGHHRQQGREGGGGSDGRRYQRWSSSETRRCWLCNGQIKMLSRTIDPKHIVT